MVLGDVHVHWTYNSNAHNYNNINHYSVRTNLYSVMGMKKIKLYLVVLKRLGTVIYCAIDYGIAYLKRKIINLWGCDK